jgi:curved DNA-binding protein CbpA
MDSEDDLYAVLGVESGASADAIKAAYRNLVREHHPDRKQLTPEDVAEADARMAALNHAWEVLSDPARRRLYDEQRHVDELLRRRPSAAKSDVTEPAALAEDPAPSSASHTPEGEHARSTTSLQASHLLLERILTTRATFRWERDAIDGFEWTLAGRAFFSRYAAALRFEEAVDPEKAKRFIATVRTVLYLARSKTKYTLFLLLVERAGALDQVRSTFMEFCASDEGKGCGIVLVDATGSRALLCSQPPADERMRSLLALLGV